MAKIAGFVRLAVLILSIAVLSFSVSYFALAWTEPAAAPPSANAPAPINISPTAQTKNGNLSVTALYDVNNASYFIDPASAVLSGAFAGPVGIGTTSPTAKLQISPAMTNNSYRPLYVQSDGTEAATIAPAAFVNSSGIGVTVGPDNGDTFAKIGAWQFTNGSASAPEDLVINRDGGKVSIGTNTFLPAYKFNVEGAIHATGDVCTDAGSGVCLSAAGSGGYWTANGNDIYNSNTGNVGIGTTTPDPDAQLHVYKNATGGWAEMEVESADTNGGADTHYVNNLSTTFSVGVDGDEGGTGAGNFRIEEYNGVDWDQRLVINPGSGNIGISEYDPQAKVDIASANTDSTLKIQRCAALPCQSKNYFSFNLGTDGKLILRESYNYVDRDAMAIDVAGKVGIGLTAPSERLDVNGNVKAAAFLYSSDERLKNNIQGIGDPLGKIMKLNGVSYTWKDSGEKGIGLTAQNVEGVFPELVRTDSASGMKSVEYGNLVAPLIEAVKEQQKMINEQKGLIDNQQKEIEALKQMINK